MKSRLFPRAPTSFRSTARPLSGAFVRLLDQGANLTKSDNIDTNLISAIHLDPVGGIAGDMFVAAMLDALPELWPACEKAIRALEPPADLTASVASYTDGVLSGSRFNVGGTTEPDNSGNHHHHHEQEPHPTAGHGHTRWHDIRRRLERSQLTSGVTAIAIDIFSRLAEAEASVHAIAVDDVMFHEVGAWDSIIDIVASAVLIDRLSQCSWSTGALPLGSGLVRTAHGMLPIPAPATVQLLKGFTFFDDGEAGERVTPTGAAILNHLVPSQTMSLRRPHRLLECGTGFGTRKLRQRSNILRAILYGEATDQTDSDWVEVLRCEIDDQSPEDLAQALDQLRHTDGVLDVCQWTVSAKKGRLAMAVQVLAVPDTADDVCRVIFDQTATLGIRRHATRRSVIHRSTRTTDAGVRVKIASRPSGMTAKAEADDVATDLTRAERERARAMAEKAAMRGEQDDD